MSRKRPGSPVTCRFWWLKAPDLRVWSFGCFRVVPVDAAESPRKVPGGSHGSHPTTAARGDTSHRLVSRGPTIRRNPTDSPRPSGTCGRRRAHGLCGRGVWLANRFRYPPCDAQVGANWAAVFPVRLRTPVCRWYALPVLRLRFAAVTPHEPPVARCPAPCPRCIVVLGRLHLSGAQPEYAGHVSYGGVEECLVSRMRTPGTTRTFPQFACRQPGSRFDVGRRSVSTPCSRETFSPGAMHPAAQLRRIPVASPSGALPPANTGRRRKRKDMRAVIRGDASGVQVAWVSDPRVEVSTDAVVRVVLASACGTDVWAYRGEGGSPPGRRAGHEFLGVVQDVGADVQRLREGDMGLAPFPWADRTCRPCRWGLSSSCARGGMWCGGHDGGQGEAVRVSFAGAKLVRFGLGADDERLPTVLTLADVMATGVHAARGGRVTEGSAVAVVGDGAVGLCAVLAAHRAGAERILLLGRHPARTRGGVSFGATDVVTERGDGGLARVRELADEKVRFGPWHLRCRHHRDPLAAPRSQLLNPPHHARRSSKALRADHHGPRKSAVPHGALGRCSRRLRSVPLSEAAPLRSHRTEATATPTSREKP